MRHSSGALLPAEATLCSIKYKSMLSMCTVHESSLELLPHTIEPLGRVAASVGFRIRLKSDVTRCAWRSVKVLLEGVVE